MNIESIYHSYLVSVEDARDYYKTKNVFHASGAGSCYRKQLYSYFDYPRDSKDSRSYRLLRLGTIVHKDIEEALKNYEDMPIDRESDVFSEDEIKLPDFNVIGTYDVGELKDGEFTLWDIKTAAAYKWSKKFGRTPDKSSSFLENLILSFSLEFKFFFFQCLIWLIFLLIFLIDYFSNKPLEHQTVFMVIL